MLAALRVVKRMCSCRNIKNRHTKVLHKISQLEYVFYFKSTLTLLLGHLLLVKGKLGSFKNVPIAPSTLSRTGGNLGIQTSRSELVIQGSLEGTVLGPRGNLPLDVIGLLSSLHLLRSLLDTNLGPVVGLIPLLEGMRIDKDNGTLHKGLGTDQLIIGCVVGNIENPHLLGADLGSPGEVTGFEAEGAELEVSPAAADGGDVLFADFGHGGRATVVPFALFAECGTASSCLAALISSGTCDSLCG
jgi:hypothetical protein